MKDYSCLRDIQADLYAGSLSLPDLVNSYLGSIEKLHHNPIFLEVWDEEARAEAEAIQMKIANKTAGVLAGMVIGIKDNICYAGHKVSAASRILEGFESLYSATVVERLLAADALIIGRLNCDEFAMGSSNENSAYGAVLNPLNEKLVTGGSSGGSAAAVAAGCCLIALGSDTGGSIRQPASFCGVVGLKPTYGRVSRHGLIAFASSFDQIGPFAKDVEDISAVMSVISGQDPFDQTSSVTPVPARIPKSDRQTYRIGYIQECFDSEGLDPEIRSKHNSLIDGLRADGHHIEAVSIPELPYLVPAYYILTTAEASSNLSRFDGIHYGYRSKKAHDIDSTYTLSRSEAFGKEVKRRIMLGTFVLSAGYYDAYYAKAQKVRRILTDRTNKLLEDFDFLLSPTTPGTAFEFGSKGDDPLKMYLEDIYTVHANLTGIPAISLPLFKHSQSGMPFGAQFSSACFSEEKLLGFAHTLMNKVSLEA